MDVEFCMKNTNNICKNDAVRCNSGSCILNCALINYRCHRNGVILKQKDIKTVTNMKKEEGRKTEC